jgi:hypothetical protein
MVPSRVLGFLSAFEGRSRRGAGRPVSPRACCLKVLIFYARWVNASRG